MAVEQTFKADVDAWVKKTKQRLEAVFRTATENVAEEVIDRTPVDTGFLRASFTGSLDSPLPMSRTGQPGQTYEPPDVSLVINSAKLGDKIYLTFTANYAAFVEYGTRNQNPVGMVRLSARNWQYHVDAAVRRAKESVGA